MAEIHIERDNRRVWPWVIVGLLALALITWLLVLPTNDGGNDPVMTDSATGAVVDSGAESTADTADGTPKSVDRFLAFVESGGARKAADSSNTVAADGIRLLVNALDGLASRATVEAQALQRQVVWLRERADSLERSRRSADQARTTRDAFIGAAALVQSLHQERFPTIGDEATAIIDAARAIQFDVPLAQQGAEIQSFFDRAAVAVRMMADSRQIAWSMSMRPASGGVSGSSR